MDTSNRNHIERSRWMEWLITGLRQKKYPLIWIHYENPLLLHALAHNSIAFSLQYYLTAFQMLIVIAMPEMFQQCLQEREVERVLYMKTCDAIVSKCLWWLTMNGEALKFVYWNWLMMSTRAKLIRRIFFLEAGLSNLQMNQEKMFENTQSILIWIFDVCTNIFQQKSTCIWISGDL